MKSLLNKLSGIANKVKSDIDREIKIQKLTDQLGEKQNLEAQRAVNTANADAQSITLRAKAEADAIKLKGEAEAKAIEAKSKALQGNPLIVQLTQAQQWDGKLPTHMMGEGSNFLLDMRK